jgi:hypothetical protein
VFANSGARITLEANRLPSNPGASGFRRLHLGDTLGPGLDCLLGGFERNLGLAQGTGEKGDEHAAESFGLAKNRGVSAGWREFEAVMYVEQSGHEYSSFPSQNATRFGSDDLRREPHWLATRELTYVVKHRPDDRLAFHLDLNRVPFRVSTKVG